MKVLLVCAGGFSTTFLMNKLKSYAEENGIEFEIAARGLGNFELVADEYDCILMGPQVGYQMDIVSEKAPGKPVAVIPPQDYGIGNCENIFKLIDSLL